MNKKILAFFFTANIFFMAFTHSKATANTIDTTITKTINSTQNLQKAIDDANPNDELVLTGIFHTNLIINKPLKLTSNSNAKVIGNKTGHVILIRSDNVTIENITITGSGKDLSTQDSAVFIEEGYKNDVIKNNLIYDNLIGVHLWGSIDSLVEYNKIIGQKIGHENDRGNGVQIWNSPGSVVKYNEISYGRDGIFTTTSSKNIFTNNKLNHVRYAIHYMYTDDSEVSFNTSIDNDIGYALMFSTNLNVHDNISVDENQGIMTNFLNKSTVYSNTILGSRSRCLFVYNSNFNEIYNNHFERCKIGIQYTAGSQHVNIYANNFLNNQLQVKYVGTTNLEWSKNHKGNYWSNHLKIDLNGDGVADSVFRPNSISDQILWEYPNTNILFNSPAMQLLSLSQSQFPALFPGGIVDSYPLMKPIFKPKIKSSQYQQINSKINKDDNNLQATK